MQFTRRRHVLLWLGPRLPIISNLGRSSSFLIATQRYASCVQHFKIIYYNHPALKSGLGCWCSINCRSQRGFQSGSRSSPGTCYQTASLPGSPDAEGSANITFSWIEKMNELYSGSCSVNTARINIRSQSVELRSRPYYCVLLHLQQLSL